MTVYGHVLPDAVSLANWEARTSNKSEKAKQRLRVVDWLRLKENNNVSLTARHFGLDRKKRRDRLKQIGLLRLNNDKSHRPKNVRKPTTDWKIVSEIVRIRKQYPTWSKYKIKNTRLRRYYPGRI